MGLEMSAAPPTRNAGLRQCISCHVGSGTRSPSAPTLALHRHRHSLFIGARRRHSLPHRRPSPPCRTLPRAASGRGSWPGRRRARQLGQVEKTPKKCARHLTGLAPFITARYRTFRPLRPCEHPATPSRPVSTRQRLPEPSQMPVRDLQKPAISQPCLYLPHGFRDHDHDRVRLHLLPLRAPQTRCCWRTPGPSSCTSRRCSSPSSTTCASRIGGRVTAQAIGKYERTSRRTGISDGIRFPEWSSYWRSAVSRSLRLT